MKVSVKVNDEQVLLKLSGLAGRMQDLTPCMRQVAGIMMDAMEENFEKEGRPDKWQELAASTIAQRLKRNKWPGKILQVSQAGLKSSISSKSDAHSATIGTNKPYAQIHQKGGMAGRGRKVKIPARPYLKLTEGDLNAVQDKIRGHMLGAGSSPA